MLVPELSDYTDVVVFPSRTDAGAHLASMLGGGELQYLGALAGGRYWILNAPSLNDI